MSDLPWPLAETLDDEALRDTRDRAFLVFCGCSKQYRRAAWDRVLRYKMEIDRRAGARHE